MTEQDYKRILKDKFINFRTSLNLPEDVTFGIEIEYENIVKDTVTYLLEEEKNFNPNLINWKSKSEIDIAEYNKLGEEMNGGISSKILIDKPSTWEALRSVLYVLDKNGAIITNKCGGHVNIGAHILEKNKTYWRNFLLLWILYEGVIYKFSSGEFSDIRYTLCCFFENVSSTLSLENIINIKNKLYLNTLGVSLFDKGHDICISKALDDKQLLNNRIEFRIPNGTLSEEIWQNYINFFAKFVIACKKELDVEKVLYKIKNNEHSAVELADYVFDNDIDKEYFLIQTLKTNKVYKKELLEHKIYY